MTLVTILIFKSKWKLFVMIHFFCLLFALKKDHSYRLKLAGNKELYLSIVGDKVRMLPFNEINKGDVISEATILGGDYKNFEFCDVYLSSKDTDPGVIQSEKKNDLTEWKLVDVENGYQIVNKDRCLSMLDSYDSATGGYFLNTKKCNNKYENVFVLLDAGYSGNFCKVEAKKMCKKMGYTKKSDGPNYFDSDDINGRQRRDREGDSDRPRKRKHDSRSDSRDYERSDRPRSRKRHRGNSTDEIDDESHYIDTPNEKTHHSMPEDIYHHHRRER